MELYLFKTLVSRKKKREYASNVKLQSTARTASLSFIPNSLDESNVMFMCRVREVENTLLLSMNNTGSWLYNFETKIKSAAPVDFNCSAESSSYSQLG